MGSNGNGHNCTHCGCENPVWNALRHKLDLNTLTRQSSPSPEPAGESLIFTGGAIYPLKYGNMDERVEALGIHRGDVVASGTLAAVQKLMDASGIKYQIRSLGDKTLLPGLIEPHIHIVQSCIMDDWLDLGPIDKISQRLRSPYNWDYLKKTLSAHIPSDPNEWVLGHMVDPALMPFRLIPGQKNQLTTFSCNGDRDGQVNDVGNLDSIVKSNPLLMMSASMHTAYLNSAACAIVYKNRSEVDSSFLKQYPTLKDFIDQTHGVLQEENQIMPAIESIPPRQLLKSLLGLMGAMKNYFDLASQRGVTLLYDAMVDPVSKRVLELYGRVYPRNVRIGYAAPHTGADFSDFPPYQAVTKEAAQSLYQGGIKLISDGSNQGLTGYQKEAYCCETKPSHGNFNICDADDPQPESTPSAYKKLLAAAMATGWPLMIHANGDRAIDFTLNAYEEALDNRSGLEKRHRIEHCSLMTKDTTRRLQALGISPSFLIGHVGYWGYAFDQAIFEDKASDMLDLCKTAADLHLHISLHSDCTVTPLGPLRSMEQAITRKMEGIRDADGNFISDPRQQPILNEGECLTRQQALKAITYDAAWQCHADAFTGSLQDGHFADFVILEKNPLDEKVPATDIRDIKVCETWKGGHKVYTNPLP
ncbi:amidohydrolase [Pseudomonas sp. BW7P1]|uniref:amidohydrolase n=1 Tax=Pseudomonas TaxID=286 RepID=UPI0021AD9387|nr:amidohydrolase family protein [Pseudomonas sp. BW7P1]UWI60234.1 amidohydrolase family protein [Pseudomonas sp. BW7P1]